MVEEDILHEHLTEEQKTLYRRAEKKPCLWCGCHHEPLLFQVWMKGNQPDKILLYCDFHLEGEIITCTQ
jgi:hypothetical protein